MAKIHSDTDVSLIARFTGRASNGLDYSGATGTQREKVKVDYAREFRRLVSRHVEPHAPGEFELQYRCERQFVCEHCQRLWTERSNVYNGGCCAADEANNPDRDAAE